MTNLGAISREGSVPEGGHIEGGGLDFFPTLLKQSPAFLSVEWSSGGSQRDCGTGIKVTMMAFDKTIEKVIQEKKKKVRNFP